MTKKVRTRFAPSPTGFLHVGGLRTALFNYLFARQQRGSFVLRLEDTDRARMVPESRQQILDALRWAGLDYDEGPDIGGPYGPYVQSERLKIYHEHAERLVASDHAYPCFCTEDRLSMLRAAQAAERKPPRYDRNCRSLSPQQAAERRSKGEPAVIRLKLPETGTVVVRDVIRGEVRFSFDTLDDQVLIKSDGYPTYHLAVVVDDHLMDITHILRAEEWLPSTPKHIFLYNAFGWELPTFGHLPQLLSPSGGKLSKRDGAVSVLDYRDRGYLSEALLNFLALLGWNPGTEQEYFAKEELVKSFLLERVQKAGAIFDQKKLDHINGVYLRKLAPDDLLRRAGEWASPLLAAYGERARQAVSLVQDRLVRLEDLPTYTGFLLKLPDYAPSLLVPKSGSVEKTRTILTALRLFFESVADEAFGEEPIAASISEELQGHAWSKAESLWPLRVALSGQAQSPGVFAIASFLQKDEVLRRMKRALQNLAQLEESGNMC